MSRVLTDSAKCFWGKAQIRRYHGHRKTSQEFGVMIGEISKSLFRRHSNGGVKPVLQGDHQIFVERSNSQIEASAFVSELIGIWNRNDEYLRIFKDLDIVTGGS